MDPVNIPAKFEVRSCIRSWDNRGYSKNLGSPCIRPRPIFSQIFNWLLFRWTLWIYLPNFKFDIRSFTHSFKNLGSPWIRPPSLFSQNFKGLLFGWTLWIYLPSLNFVALPGSPWIRPRSLFSKIFHGLVFGWTLWMYRPNLQSVALAIPEIIVIAVLGWGCEPQSWGSGGRRGYEERRCWSNWPCN